MLLMDGDFGLANLDILLDSRPKGTIRDVPRSPRLLMCSRKRHGGA
jgi:MinD-like ATPase involved in chromosome partitioning or flagellar assembly